MSYTVEKLGDEPIILDILNADYVLADDGESNVRDILSLLDAQNVPVFLIMDLTEVSFSFDDIVQGVGLATKQHQLFKHPNVRENVIVTNKRFVKLAAEGLNNPIFGSVNVRTFETRSAALAYARSQAAGQPR